MKRILITGGAGFVGSSLALLFKQNKADVEIICMDNLSRRGSELNLPRLHHHGVKFVHGDVRDPEDLARVGEVDWLIECSAEPSVHAGFGESPAYLINTNLNGLLHCLEYLRQRGGKLVFLSTSRVYPIATLRNLLLTPKGKRLSLDSKFAIPGLSEKGIAEHFPLEGPRSLYGATKLSGELFIQEYCQMYGLQAIINRCGVLAGAWQMGKVDQGFLALWIARHFFGGKLQYMGFGGEGLQVRDVLHVSDLFTLVNHQMSHIQDHTGAIYNVGGGMKNSVSLCELTEIVEKTTGRHCEIGRMPDTREADIPFYVTDNSKVTQKTGWEPTMNVERIVEEVYTWMQQHKATLEPIFTK